MVVNFIFQDSLVNILQCIVGHQNVPVILNIERCASPARPRPEQDRLVLVPALFVRGVEDDGNDLAGVLVGVWSRTGDLRKEEN